MARLALLKSLAQFLAVPSGRLIGRTSAGTGAAEGIAIGTGLSLSGGVLAATATASAGTMQYTLAGAKAASIPTDVSAVLITDRANALFVEDASVDATYATNNPLTSFRTANSRGFKIFVPATGIALEWLGGRGDNATDNLPAMNAALARLAEIGNASAVTPSGIVQLGIGKYFFSGAINLRYPVIIQGHSGGTHGMVASILRFPASNHGIIINKANTSGYTVGTFVGEADGTVLRNLHLIGSGAPGTGDFHGVFMRARAYLQDVNCDGWPGAGVQVLAGSGFGGNANCFRYTGGRITNCRWGFYADGTDANAGVITNVDCTNNRDWGFFDNSFLGNTYVGCHAELNGMPGRSNSRTLTAVVSHNSKLYVVRPGDEGAASTTVPGTNSFIWQRFDEPPDPIAGVTVWASGMSAASGGSFCMRGDANTGGIMIGCYAEGGQPPVFMGNQVHVVGGVMGGGVAGRGTFITTDINTADNNGIMRSRHGFRKSSNDPVGHHVDIGMGSFEILSWYHETKASVRWTLRYRGDFDSDLALVNYAGYEPFIVTAPNTAITFDRTNTVPGMFAVDKMGLGGKIIGNATAPPTAGSHAVGEYRFNKAPVAGGNWGWVCVEAGTPGVWKPIGGIST